MSQTNETRKSGSNRLTQNMFGKGQRIITDAYRSGWEHAFVMGKKKKVTRRTLKRKG